MASPTLLAPLDGMSVDGSAATFSWHAVPGAQDYRLQVAADNQFENIQCTVASGRTTLLTLLEMLPSNGSTFYWRVQGFAKGSWQPWSEPASFKASTDEQARLDQEIASEASQVATTAAVDDAVDNDLPLYMVESTSKGQVALFMTIMIASFALLFIWLAIHVLG